MTYDELAGSVKLSEGFRDHIQRYRRLCHNRLGP